MRVPPDVRNEEIPHPPSASEGVAQKRGGELRASNVEHFATTAARCGPTSIGGGGERVYENRITGFNFIQDILWGGRTNGKDCGVPPRGGGGGLGIFRSSKIVSDAIWDNLIPLQYNELIF